MDRLTEAVEALARAMNWWREDLANRRGEWSIEVNEEPELGGAYTIRRWEIVGESGRRSSEAWRVTHLEAMLVLRCALLGATRERCPECEARGGPMEWYFSRTWLCGPNTDPWWLVRDEKRITERLGPGWTFGRFTEGPDSFPSTTVVASRPCPTCSEPTEVECEACEGDGEVAGDSGYASYFEDCKPCSGKGSIPGKPTGYVGRSWAEVVLGAMPRECVMGLLVPEPCGEDCPDCAGAQVEPGDPEANAKLTRLADQLQAQALDGLGGDCPEQHPDLGVWLALYLGQQPCDVTTVIGVEAHASLGYASLGCRSCAGSGLALGHHTNAMAEAGHAIVEGGST